MRIYLKGVSIEDTPFLLNYLYVKILYNMNKVITTQGNVQFQFPDGKIVNVHPNHIYTVFNEDTVSFILVGLPKTSGLSTMTSKAEDLELNGVVYSFAELPNAVSEAFAIAGAQARCEIVDELPETGYTNTIYLVPQPAPQTGFDEYVYILDQGWELIGDTSIEMDNYVLKTVFSGYTADTAVVLNGLRTDVDTTSGNVITETERALLAESGLSDAIVAEIARAENAESGLTDAIDAEETAREAADGVISGAVDTVSSGLTQEAERAIAVESGLSDAIDAEETRALAAEDALDGKIDAVSAATDAALANKQNLLIAGENITISSTTSGDVISAEGGGSITIDQTLDSGSTNAVANSAVSAALNYNDMFLYRVDPVETWDGHPTGRLQLRWRNPYNGFTGTTQDAITLMKINNIPLIKDYVSGISNLNLVETSAITTSVTSASTDSEIPSAKAMYDELAEIDVKFIDDAKYELSGTTHVINFYNGDTVKATIDCSDFIIDGMVDNVYIENGYLVIDFNTESGKQDIQIPLTDIFNPNNYYTKSETSGATELSTEFATKLNTADFNTYSGSVDTRLAEDEEVTSRALNALNEAVSGKVSTSDFEVYSGAVETALNGKANSSDVYLKSETSGATEISTALSNKLDATAYTPTDLSNYYTKSETSGATEIATALSGKVDSSSVATAITSASTDSEIPTAKAVWEAASGGGGKAVSAGTNISITTGETADTINCTLPITVSKNGSQNEITFNNVAKFSVRGYAGGAYAVAIGDQTVSNGFYAIAIGYGARTNYRQSFSYGYYSVTNNEREFSTGSYNNSVTGSSTFGDSGNTLFSVGNGTADNARHNAFEVRQNGDIYCSDGTNDVKLQDTITATAANTTALGGMKIIKLTESEYAALVTKDSNTLYVVIPDPTNP